MAAIKKLTLSKIATEECKEEGCCSSSYLRDKIAECAYYKAENRGFLPGFEAEDWYEAEQEVLEAEEEGVF